jgi:6-phosphogluconate dehydrogenase
MKTGSAMPDKADIGVIGLGVMGLNLALNMEEKGFPVAVWNRHSQKTADFIGKHQDKRLAGAETLKEFVEVLSPPRRILIMVKAGRPVDEIIERLKPLLFQGDILIDGGNSFFKDTVRRDKDLRKAKIEYLGLGISGGEEGARHGPSLMPGGSRQAYEIIRSLLETVAAQSDSGPCVTYLGPDGAGHFVKMVHNAIEYGLMQILAEIYDLLHRNLKFEAAAIADQFRLWNSGPMESFLMGLTADILQVRDRETDRPLVEMVLDKAEQKGTGRWAGQEALELGVPVPTIMAALFARNLSAMKAERQHAARIVNGPDPETFQGDIGNEIETLYSALVAATVCAYAEGLALISRASGEYDWQINLTETARIWKGGCIIRSRLLDLIMNAYHQNPDLSNLLLDKDCLQLVENNQLLWRRAACTATRLGIPVPAITSGLAYFDSYRTAVLPQNLTQSQRDAFGAHTYRRVDRPDADPVHTDWLNPKNQH